MTESDVAEIAGLEGYEDIKSDDPSCAAPADELSNSLLKNSSR